MAQAENRRLFKANHQSHFRRHDQQEDHGLHGILHHSYAGERMGLIPTLRILGVLKIVSDIGGILPRPKWEATEI